MQYLRCVYIKITRFFSIFWKHKGLITCKKIGELNGNIEALQPLKVWDQLFEEKPVFWKVKSLQHNKSVRHGFQKLKLIPNVSVLEHY